MANKTNGTSKTNGNGNKGNAQSRAAKEANVANEQTAVATEPATLAHTDERIPEAFRPLVESGALVATVDRVKVEVKGKPEPATREHIRLTAATIEGALALVSGRMNKVDEGENKGNGVLDYFNYGYDLGVRSNERNKLLQTLEGPDAAIRRAAKGLVAAGIPEAAALTVAVNALKAEGKLPADFVIPAGFQITAAK